MPSQAVSKVVRSLSVKWFPYLSGCVTGEFLSVEGWGRGGGYRQKWSELAKVLIHTQHCTVLAARRCTEAGPLCRRRLDSMT